MHLAHLRRESALFSAALEGADWSAPVTACPDWTLRDLVLHTGGVHRWALGRVTGGLREPRADLADGDLAPWFADGAGRLHDALAAADPDAPCKGFEDPVTVAFWIRRQAHETAMHRVDAQLTAPDPVPDDLALDGIAEVFDVFAPRQVALGRSGPPPYGLVLVAPEATMTVPGPDPVTVRGSAHDLLCALWRRPASIEVDHPARLQAVLDTGLTP